MATIELQYRSKRTGDLRTYTYETAYVTAAERCRRAIRQARQMHRTGGYWQANPHSRRWRDHTIQQVVAAGHARIDGDVVVSA